MTDAEKIKKLLEANRDYWQSRSLLTTLDTIQKEEAYYKKLKEIYDDAYTQLNDKLAVVYNRYAKNNNMSNTQAYKVLSKADELAYKRDVNKYLEEARQNAGNPEWESYLLNESLKHQHTVLNKLKTEWKDIAYKLDYKGELFGSKIYQNASYQTQYAANNEIGIDFSKISPEKLEAVIEEDWTGTGKFSELVWKNTEKLAKALDDILVRGFATGSSFSKMAKALASRMDVSYNEALRLIRTESARLENQGLLDTYKQIGAEQFQFVATLDSRTSDICASMDGEIFNIDDAQVGLNVPPLHPNCRSVIAPYYGDKSKERIMLDPETNKNVMTEQKNYVDYLKDNLGDNKRAEAISNNKADISTLTKAQPTTMEALQSIATTMAITNPSIGTLTNDERRAINRYVSGGSWTLNDSLRNDYPLSEENKKLMNDLDTALKKLEYYQGDLIRDIDVDDLETFINDYTVGKITNFPQFLSTTVNTGTSFNNNPNVIYSIKAKAGRDVRTYNAGEAEVLFERNSKFLITNIIYDENSNILYIDMEQVI